MEEKKQKVIMAMSGGVDSAVAAALLVEKGYSVEGVYMKLFNEQKKDARIYSGSSPKQNRQFHCLCLPCKQGVLASRQILLDAEQAARAVANKLGIRFKVLDLRKEFKKRVINYFLKEFKAGRTPNPCVVCNKQIKFGLLFDKAFNPPVGGGADFMATGHYARIKNCHCEESRLAGRRSNLGDITGDRHSSPGEARDDIIKLLAAKDKTKDQSYFLYNLTQKKLAKILFPLENYKKSEVYKLAEKWNLPYKKGESVDICFVGALGHQKFLQKYLGTKTGKIIDVNGNVLGKHQGLWFYTIGQRAQIGGPGPFYVVKLDKKINAVIVSNNFRGSQLVKKSLIAKNINWVAGAEPKMPFSCNARIRYGHAAVPCVIASEAKQSLGYASKLFHLRQTANSRNDASNYIVKFKNYQRAITPGQSVVFYKRNEILGGGVIEN